jgi:hypothetical protein
MPAEPIIGERGLTGFNFHGLESMYPYIASLLTLDISWRHEKLNDALSQYIEQMAKQYITIEFIYYEEIIGFEHELRHK